MELDFNYSSVAGIVAAAEQAGLPISRLVLNQQALQMEQSEESIYEHMKSNYRVMAECIEPGCKKDLRSTSGLTGGSAYKMRRIAESGTSLTGSFLSGALYRALADVRPSAALRQPWRPLPLWSWPEALPAWRDMPSPLPSRTFLDLYATRWPA